MPSQADANEGVSYLKFDDSFDLLWVGDKRGTLTAYCGCSLQLYSACKAHDSPVLKILNHKKGILSLSADGIRLGKREGPTISNLEFSVNTKLTSMTYTSNTQTEVLVGGEADSTGFKIYKIDTVHNNISGYISYKHDILHLDTNLRYVIIGRMDGIIDILDPKTDTIIKSFNPISNGLFYMSVKDNNLITTSYSVKAGGKNKQPQTVFDAWVTSYNLANLSVGTPIPFPGNAAYALHHPIISNLLFITNIGGDNMSFIDTMNPTKMKFYQCEMPSYITAIDLSASGEFFAFSDPMQNLFLWSRDMTGTKTFALVSNPLEYPTPMTEVIPLSARILKPDSSLSSIKLPPYTRTLSSVWPSDLKFKVGALPQQIDPEIIRSSETTPNGFTIAKYSKEIFGPRNHVSPQYVINKSGNDGLAVPKFISERDDYVDYYSVVEDGLLPEPIKPKKPLVENDYSIFEYTCKDNDIPNAFKKQSISYSKFGVDDFDFDFYNRTEFAGLEIHSGNSFMNPLFQLYRFIPSFFNYAINSLSEDATDEINLLMELGYLFDMLNKANGRHCSASNFNRLFSSLPEVQNFGLVNDNIISTDDYKQRKMIQTLNKFLLRRLVQDECALYQSDIPEKLNSLCGVITVTNIFSNFCPLAQKRENIYQTIEMNTRPLGLNSGLQDINILNYLEASMNRHIQQQIRCDNCHSEHPVNAALQIDTLPPIVVLNIDMNNQLLNEIRMYKDWLVPYFYSAQATMGTPVLRKNIISGITGNKKQYELIGFTAQITNKQNESHLVTFSKIKKNPNDKGTWFLFNDFLVIEIEEKEALDMSVWWKKPVVVIYKRVDFDNQFHYNSYNNLNDSILYKDHFARGTREGKIIEYELLTRDEAPEPGSLVALDAEFIELAPAEFEFTNTGVKKLMRPPKLSLGRISVLRGSGIKEGTCFIDDYIETHEMVYDYKTSFSGLESNDLDVEKSNKSLVSLQTAYRKIWLLLNMGCVFVGHSLIGDFRMINIQVPPAQVRDTAICYYNKSEKRKLGLKFLVYHVLQDEVQKGNHDSIEDAASALRLYKKYLVLKRTGRLNGVLEKLYIEGQMSGFRV